MSASLGLLAAGGSTPSQPRLHGSVSPDQVVVTMSSVCSPSTHRYSYPSLASPRSTSLSAMSLISSSLTAAQTTLRPITDSGVLAQVQQAVASADQRCSTSCLANSESSDYEHCPV